MIQNVDGVEAACAVGIPDDICHELPAIFIVKDQFTNQSDDELKHKILGKFLIINSLQFEFIQI